jgi:hypothetical protein
MPWIIDKDYIANPEAKAPSNQNAVGLMGPRGYTGNGSELTKQFRMLDDDRVLCYEGRNDTDDDDYAFGPLDDVGGPNAGCTTIEYNIPGKGWKAL